MGCLGFGDGMAGMVANVHNMCGLMRQNCRANSTAGTFHATLIREALLPRGLGFLSSGNYCGAYGTSAAVDVIFHQEM